MKGKVCSPMWVTCGNILGSFFQFHMSFSHQAKGFTSLWVSVAVGTTHHVKYLLVSWKEEARIKISEIKKGREKKLTVTIQTCSLNTDCPILGGPHSYLWAHGGLQWLGTTFTLELLSLSLTSCVTSAKLFNISEEQFSHLKTKKKKRKDYACTPHWMVRKTDCCQHTLNCWWVMEPGSVCRWPGTP